MADERKGRTASREELAALVAEAARMERALAAMGWRLAELLSPDERASALVAGAVQMGRDHMPDHEHDRVLALTMELLLPDQTDAGRRLRAVVTGAVKAAAATPDAAATMVRLGSSF